MLRDFAWRAFEQTGSIESYMFFKEIEEFKKARNETKMAEEEAAPSNS
ncbi:MAG TPA: YqzL family protein [Clostridiaceae bacterium]|nr:YqzL family protein [Clostridiaceae bacterium]